MRRFCTALCGLLVLPLWATAQQQPAVDPNQAKIDEVLTKWEKAMTSMNSVQATVSRITNKKVFKTVEKFSGEAKFLKSGANQPCRASLYVMKVVQGPKGDEYDKDSYERYIFTGTYMFSFDPANKVLRFQEQGRVGQVGDNPLELLFGMKKEGATKRFRFIWVAPDPNYYYLRIVPRFKEDERQFKEARVALTAANFMPRQLWLLNPNDDEVTWDFPRTNTTVEIRPQEFENPATPTGWKTEKFQRDR